MQIGKKLIGSSISAFFVMLIWEIVEELLENVIAYAISSAIWVFFTKVISTLFIIGLTQSFKIIFKKFLYHFVREITYKKGKDKMEKFKTILKKVGNGIKSAIKFVFRSNPKSCTATLANALICGLAGITLDLTSLFQNMTFPELVVFGVNIFPYILASITFMLIEFGIIDNFEKNSTADIRIAQEKEEKLKKKEEKAKLKEEKEKAKEQVEFEKEALAMAYDMKEKENKEKIEAEKKALLENRAKELLEQLKNNNS